VLQKWVFAGTQYALLAAFLFACWGIGRGLMRLRPRRPALLLALPVAQADAWPHPIAIALGMGVFVCVLQALAIAGRLAQAPVAASIALGAALGIAEIVRAARSGLPGPARVPRSRAERGSLAALALLALPTLVAPLGPPMAWDELMYHLPHARQWASSGQLQVNEWLRYPWFPYNYDLLFAGALLLGNDVLPHLLHAAAGWLAACLIYRLGVEHLRDRVAACVAAGLWLVLTMGQYDRAYIDMGVALFVLVACLALQRWRDGADRTWLAACAFSLGVAAGAKYQVLALLPFFAVVLALRDRRASTWLLAGFCLALPCIYWYARNAVATGDPFNPVGGRLFGFTDWNLADHRGQFEDLRSKAGWPHWALWPALAAPFVAELRRRPAVRGAMVLAAYMVLVWIASSRYPRYLVSAYPLLALLAAAGWMHLARTALALVAVRHRPLARQWAGGLLVACVGVASVVWSLRYGERIAPTPQAREALLRERVAGYAMWTYLHAHPAGRIYQMGLEESLYYAPQPIWGDAFGPWRYIDFVDLAPQDLYRKLAGQGFDALLVNTANIPQTTSKPGFEKFFVPVHTDAAIRLYRLAPEIAP
jgi:4-amino-4-deoxy-L-arabinose transferase-like glycosyltransferase